MKKWDVLEEEKIEKENSKVREFLTRNLPKKIVAVGLSAVIALSALTFAGCGNTNQPAPSTPNNSQVQQTTQQPNSNESEVVQKPIVEEPVVPPVGGEDNKDEIPVSTIEGFVENLRQNFACTITKDGVQTTYVVDDGVVKVESAGTTSIYASDEGGNYVYSLLEGGEWEKNFAQTQYNKDAILYDTLSRVAWSGYDKNSNTFSGTVDGNSISFKIDGNNATISGALVANVSQVGQTELSLPSMEDVDDKTIPQEYIYQNGDYNIVLMKEVLEDWMKGNNQWGKDIMAKRQFDDSYTTDKIVYIKPNNKTIDLGVIMKRGERPYFYKIELTEDFCDGFKSQSLYEKDAFVDYLNSVKPKTVGLTDVQVGIDTEVSSLDFEKMTENVFKKLTNKGVQSGGVNVDAPETKLANFDEARILYGFKGVKGGVIAEEILGYRTNWTQYYVVEYQGKIEFVEIDIISSTYNNVENEKENVIKDTNGWWYIRTASRVELDDENSQLYDVGSAVSLSTKETAGENLQEKNKEL